jgi:aspartate aminotransferase-like enzyme
VDDGEFRGALREDHGVVVAGAQAQIKGKVFRIGHMGFCTMTDMMATWGAIEAVLRKLGHSFEAGAAVAEVAARMG